MDAKIEAVVMALDDFAEAASSLLQAWEEASDWVDAAAEGYPFPDSFEDVTYGIVKWRQAVRERLLPRPEEPMG